MSRWSGRSCTVLVSLCLGVVASLGVVGTAEASTHGRTTIVLTTRNSPTMGAYLTSSHGFTLYTFTEDTSTRSSCTGACGKLWPPLLVPKSAKLARLVHGVPASRLGTVKRPNGTSQLTYEGRPLYLFAGDKHVGQTSGEGVGNVWFVALVTPAKATTAAQTPSPTTAAPTAQPAAHTSTASGSSGGTTATSPPPTNAPAPPQTTQPPPETTQPAPPTTTQPPPTTTQPPQGGG